MEDIRIPQLNIGDKLYHYTSAEGLLGISDGEFWITEGSFLNDSTEFKIASEVFGKILDQKIKNVQIRKKVKQIIADEMKKINSNNGNQSMYSGYYVISFCLEKDSILMWSQYSDFVGYCMEFDYRKLIDSFEGPTFSIFNGKVIYDFEEQKECIEKTLQIFIFDDMKEYPKINEWEDLIKVVDEDEKNLVLFISVILSLYNMFFKKKCFEGENEYRIIFSCMHNGIGDKEKLSEKQYFRVKNEVLIPFVKKRFNKESLSAVLVGPKNNSDIVKKGLEYFYRNKEMDIKISKSKVPLRY